MMKEMKKLPYARKQQILTKVKEDGCVKIEHLAKDFNVSYMTIYRDVQELEKEGNVLRVYGGIKAADGIHPKEGESDHRFLKPYGDAVIEERFYHEYEEKKNMARVAASFVKDGDVIAIDPSTTTLHMCDFLQTRKIMVITTSLSVALQFSASTTVTVILCGGIMSRYSLSMVGQFLPGVLKHICVNKCFVSSNGFTAENGLTDMSLEESDAKRQLIAASQQLFVLIDHTKIDKYSAFVVCKTNEIDVLITGEAVRDMPRENEVMKRSAELGCKVVMAERNPDAPKPRRQPTPKKAVGPEA